jgi:CDP-diacylglycerol---glycerol-3-phosphate 3-phosphatidyltransferase
VNGLYALKPWYTRRLTRVVDTAVARRVSPDVFTWTGVTAAAAAGASLALGWWVLAALLLAVRLAGANLDGAVARARDVSRPWGFVLNEVGDRVSDLLMFAGLAAFAAREGGAGRVVAVLVAATAATLPTFASLAAAGAGARRRNGGPLGKTERCALAVLAVAVPTTLPWVCALVAAGSVLTAVLRLTAARADLVAVPADDAAGAAP